MRRYHLLACTALAFTLRTDIIAQNLPDEWYQSPDGRILYTDGRELPTGLYRTDTVRAIHLTFAQTNYWTLLENNYDTQTPISATLTFDGETYDSVGVRFKGQTSYFMLPNGAEKMSFDIKMDEYVDGQDLKGYSSLNLNNGFQDNSMMREVVYEQMIRRHIPAVKTNFLKLYINGQNWGLYPNVQGIDGTYLKEWYFSNDGTRWRADAPAGGMGGMWGDGTAALNYLGSDTTDYQPYYTLQKSDKVHPWDDLVRVCDKLNNTASAVLEDTLNNYLNIDRALWFLACENAYADDDGYIYKGKMDYSFYWEPESDRINMQEYDGNSVLEGMNVNWSPFYHETNVNYPLLNKVLAVPALRQRYLAHLRTVLADCMDATTVSAVISGYQTMVDTIVQNDPKKLMTYGQWNSGVTSFSNAITTRRNTLLANTEMAQVPPVISAVDHIANGVLNGSPQANTVVDVQATVSSGSGVQAVTLYYSSTLTGLFNKVGMLDDGAHNDGASGDGVFGASIPGQQAGAWVRYYVQAAANNSAHTVAYAPAGAEHDVYIVQVQLPPAPATGVVINEFMASNSNGATDQNGQTEDWIELYNNSSSQVDLSLWFISDTPFEPTKWRLPVGTTIPANGYKIFWADEDQGQGNDHASFKLSSSGESVVLLNADTLLVDAVDYEVQETDKGYARVPNGSGPFVIQWPTFAGNNDVVGVEEVDATPLPSVYPNPATDAVTILTNQLTDVRVEIFDATLRSVWRGSVRTGVQVNTAQWAPGTYMVRCGDATSRLVVTH